MSIQVVTSYSMWICYPQNVAFFSNTWFSHFWYSIVHTLVQLTTVVVINSMGIYRFHMIWAKSHDLWTINKFQSNICPRKPWITIFFVSSLWRSFLEILDCEFEHLLYRIFILTQFSQKRSSLLKHHRGLGALKLYNCSLCNPLYLKLTQI